MHTKTGIAARTDFYIMNITKGRKLLIASVLGVLIYLSMVLIFKYFIAPNLTDV